MKTSRIVCTALLLAASQIARATDIPPGLTPSGGTDSDNYTLIGDGSVTGYGIFSGNFDLSTYMLSVYPTSEPIAFDGVLSGSAISVNLHVVGTANPVILNGANTFTGHVMLEAGLLRIGNASALGANGNGLFRTLDTSTLDLNGQNVDGKNAFLAGATTFQNSNGAEASWSGYIDAASTLTFNTSGGDIAVSGDIYGNGAAKTGAHTLTVSGDNTGMTQVWNLEAGTIKFGSANSVGQGVGVSGTGTTIDLNGQTLTGKPLQVVSANAKITNTATGTASWNGSVANSGDLTIENTDGVVVITGAISGTGAIHKSGTGSATFTSLSSDYSGNTFIDQGELILQGRSVFYIGDDGVTNYIDGAGFVSFEGQFVFDLIGADSTIGNTWNIVDISSLIEYWDDSFQVYEFTDEGGGLWKHEFEGVEYEFSENTGQLRVVPEPSTVVLLTLAGCVLLFSRRKRTA